MRISDWSSDVCSSDLAEHPRAQEGDEHGDDDAHRPRHEQDGEIGKIAAHHQYFAMRHVDDAHQPEAERQAQRGEDVERRHAEAVEKLAEEKCGVHGRLPVAWSLARSAFAAVLERENEADGEAGCATRSEENTDEQQSPMRITDGGIYLKKNKRT